MKCFLLLFQDDGSKRDSCSTKRLKVEPDQTIEGAVSFVPPKLDAGHKRYPYRSLEFWILTGFKVLQELKTCLNSYSGQYFT